MSKNNCNYAILAYQSGLVILLIGIAILIATAPPATATNLPAENNSPSYSNISLHNETASISTTNVNKSELSYEDRIRYNKELQDNNKSWGSPIQPPNTKESIHSAEVNNTQKSKWINYDFQTNEISEEDSTETTVQSSSIDTQDSSTQQIHPEGVIGNDDRTQIQNTHRFPHSAIVKLRITKANGDRSMCSGSIINEPNSKNNHVLTAGHCVHDSDAGGFVDSITVIPAADGNTKPFNEAEAVSTRTYAEWIQNEDYRFDLALLTLDRSIGDYTGAFGYGYEKEESNIYSYSPTHIAGYPADKPPNTMWSDSNTGLGTFNETGISDRIHKYEMDTYGGMSGAPVWVHNYNRNGEYKQLTVHAYDGSASGYNYGTRINKNKYNTLQSWIDKSNRNNPPNDKPDLVDDGVQWATVSSTDVAGGEQFSISSDVRNIGTAQAGCFNVTYYASNDTAISAGADHKIGSATTCDVTPFTAETSSFDGDFPTSIPNGTYYVGWIIDPENDVAEFSASNNQAVITNRQLTVSSQNTAYPPSGTAAQYDNDNNGKIDQGELVDGLQDYSNDNIDQGKLVDILIAYSNSN